MFNIYVSWLDVFCFAQRCDAQFTGSARLLSKAAVVQSDLRFVQFWYRLYTCTQSGFLIGLPSVLELFGLNVTQTGFLSVVIRTFPAAQRF